MLIRETNIDAQLDYLEEKDGRVLLYDKNTNFKDFCQEVIKIGKSQSGTDDQCLLIFNHTIGNYKIEKRIRQIGSTVEKVQLPIRLHVLSVPSTLFKIIKRDLVRNYN